MAAMATASCGSRGFIGGGRDLWLSYCALISRSVTHAALPETKQSRWRGGIWRVVLEPAVYVRPDIFGSGTGVHARACSLLLSPKYCSFDMTLLQPALLL